MPAATGPVRRALTPPPAHHRTPTHLPTSPTTTDCDGRLMAGRQQTAPSQQRPSKDDTAHPHQPGARPNPPHPDPAHSCHHHPAKAKVKFPLQNRMFTDFTPAAGATAILTFSMFADPSPAAGATVLLTFSMFTPLAA